MKRLILIAATALVTSAVWLAVTATNGLGAQRGQSYDMGKGDIANFGFNGLECLQLFSNGYITLCDRPGTTDSKYVTFTGNWIKVWSETKQPSRNCCKTLLFSTPRNP